MEVIGNLFQQYVILLYYDSSKDDTLKKIQTYKQRFPDRLHIHINTDPLSLYRTHNIAKGRNWCLEKIRECYHDWEYFIMMDCDDVCSGKINLGVLYYYFTYGRRGDWDGLTFHHPQGYYDIWALSIDPLFLSYQHFFRGKQIYQNYINYWLKTVSKYQLIPCYSAFNGFAIYRTEKFLNCSYEGIYNIDYIPKEWIQKNERHTGKRMFLEGQLQEDCEHRKFHFQAVMENKARLRISPMCLFLKPKHPIQSRALF